MTGRLVLCVSLRLPRPDSEAVAAVINGALSDFCQTMLIFEKHQNKHTHTTGPRPYFDTSAPHVRTQPWQRRSRKQVKKTQAYSSKSQQG